MLPLRLTTGQKKLMENEGEVAYPNECCGILFGREVDGVRIVDSIDPAKNAFDADEVFHRFAISPSTLLAAERKCGGGRMVLGFYHSHPDHPARPSEYDRAHAWPFYSYVIVAVHGRRAVDMTCWLLDGATEQFGQQPIEAAAATDGHG